MHVRAQGNRLECLRALPPTTVQQALPTKRGLLLHRGVRWFPAVDGSVVPDYPVHLMRQGAYNKDVDVLIGNNANEGTLFLLIAYNVAVFESAWRDLIPATFPHEHVRSCLCVCVCASVRLCVWCVYLPVSSSSSYFSSTTIMPILLCAARKSREHFPLKLDGP